MKTYRFEATARFEGDNLELKIGNDIFTIQGQDRRDFGKAIQFVGTLATKWRRRGGVDRNRGKTDGTLTTA